VDSIAYAAGGSWSWIWREMEYVLCVCVCALSHVVLVLHQQPLNYDGKSVDEMISYHIISDEIN